MNPEEIRQLMECCRRGIDDADDERLAALEEVARQDPAVLAQWEAVSRWDAAIADAMQDVPVPDGLADRLLLAVAEQQQPRADVGAVDGQVMLSAVSGEQWWNRWSVRLVVAAAAAILVLAVGYWAGFSDNLTANQVVENVPSWLGEIDQEAWRQQSLPQAAERCVADETLKFRPLSWQTLATQYDAQTVVMQANVPPARGKAWLFVINTRLGRKLPRLPPAMPDSTTRGLCVGVWKNDDRLCVLVVRGNQQDYGRLLRSHLIARRGYARQSVGNAT